MPKIKYLDDQPKPQTCLDCLHCKMVEKSTKLRCSLNLWSKPGFNCKNGEVKLLPQEKKTFKFKTRNIFRKAKKCNYFESLEGE